MAKIFKWRVEGAVNIFDNDCFNSGLDNCI